MHIVVYGQNLQAFSSVEFLVGANGMSGLYMSLIIRVNSHSNGVAMRLYSVISIRVQLFLSVLMASSGVSSGGRLFGSRSWFGTWSLMLCSCVLDLDSSYVL